MARERVVGMRGVASDALIGKVLYLGGKSRGEEGKQRG